LAEKIKNPPVASEKRIWYNGGNRLEKILEELS
jgi:hypothetical protein